MMGIRRWMKRNRMYLRRVKNKVQNNTCDAQVMNSFRGYVNFMIEMLKISKSNITHMDETNVNFYVEAAHAYYEKGNNTVS